MSASLTKADMTRTSCDVRFVPCVDGSELARRIFTSQAWSVQPCVRPVDAVHMTAGHNALRGSGPGQKPAFDNAMAHVGCPDRRLDRLCITCCSPSQPSHHAGCSARFSSRRECDGFLVALALRHHGPDHSGNLVGKRDSGDLGWPSRQQCGEPWPILGAVDLGIADDGKRASHEQAAQITVTLFADTTEPVLASTRVLLRHQPDPGREIASRSEGFYGTRVPVEEPSTASKADSCTAAKGILFDHSVSRGEQHWWDIETKRLCRLEINDQLVL